MAVKNFDPIDAMLSLAMGASGFIMVGIATFSIFGLNFSDTMVSLAGFDLTTAYVVSLVALFGTIATNDNTSLSELQDDIQKLDDYYYYAIVGTVVLLFAWLLFPSIPEFFRSEDLWGLIYVIGTTTAQAAIGWML